MAKTPTKVPSGRRKAATKAGTQRVAFSPPPTWYFPTPDPDVVMACDYNPADRQYNLNCRPMRIRDVPRHVVTAINKSSQT